MSSTLAAQQKASLTAYDCAAARAAVHASTGYRSFDYLAADMVAHGSASLRAKLLVGLVKLGAPGLARWLLSKGGPGIDVFMFARQTVPDDLIRQSLSANPETQVVILGAGLDTSGLRIGSERRGAGQTPGTRSAWPSLNCRFERTLPLRGNVRDLPASRSRERRSTWRLPPKQE